MFNLTTQSKLYLRETIKFKKTVVALKPILGKILLDKDYITYQRRNFYMEDFVYILVFCEAQVSDRAWVLKYQLECDKVQ